LRDPLRPKISPVRRCSIAWTVLIILVAGPFALAEDAQDAKKLIDQKFAGKAAWQVDEKLGEKWQEITGRFIFQRTCLSCHTQGPASYPKPEWEKILQDFPDERHVGLLPQEFGDLTAMFSYGRMVANDQARYRALKTFLLKYAPEKKDVKPGRDPRDAIDLFPLVGQNAPDFSIVDINGKKHSLKTYIQNQEPLILVFSRAHR